MSPLRALGATLAAGGLISASGCAAASPPSPTPASRPTAARNDQPASALAPQAASRHTPAGHHYLYVFPDQAMYVYDIDHRHRLVQHVSLPGVSGIRGVVASPRTHTLYLSYGEDGGPGTAGSLLAYNLLTGAVTWKRTYRFGIDSMAISSSGSRIYMPDGELSSDGVWMVIDAHSGTVVGRIDAGKGPHNTVVGLSGTSVYLGGRNYPYLDVASTATNRVFRRIGPLRSSVRPFTVNGAETLAYTTATGFLGFQVSSIRTGRVLYTESFGPHFRYDPATFSPSAPSHGISLSPDERQLWVIDGPNGFVHVFDVAGAPQRPPRPVADIKLAHPLTGAEAGCSYDCAGDGWLLHSRSGCYVYVGDSGDVIDTATRRAVAFLPPLRNSRKFLEIDWRSGKPVSTTTRSGLGYVRRGSLSAAPKCH
jgi:DNA-binding beta-propeller fold protein YncE